MSGPSSSITPDPLLDSSNDPTDAESLQSLVTSLRASLTSSQTTITTQQSRIFALSEIEEQFTTLKDSHAFISAAKEAVESQLKDEIKKREVAEETVESLRGQVEAARRGVMTLQKQEKERKRMSTINLSPATGLGLGGFGDEEILNEGSNNNNNNISNLGIRNDKASKRQSIINKPHQNTHRRVSSQSEPDGLYASSPTVTMTTSISTSPKPSQHPASNVSTTPGSTNPSSKPGLREFRLGTSTNSANNSAVTPTTTTFSSPPRLHQQQQQRNSHEDISLHHHQQGSRSNSPNPEYINIQSINPDDHAKLQRENDRLKSELAESEEARQASETCLKALREFIALSPGGGGVDIGDNLSTITGGMNKLDLGEADLLGIKLPPLPTDRDPDEMEIHSPPIEEKKGWGFKLWKGQTQNTTHGPLSPGLTSGTQQTQLLSPPLGSNKSLPNSKQNSPLPTPTDHHELTNSNSYTTTSSTPLANFVSSWTRTVASGSNTVTPNTPGQISTHPGTGVGPQSPPTNARKLSSFFSRRKIDDEKEKEKELPIPPRSDDSRSVRSGTGTESIHEVKSIADENVIERRGSILEPSPQIVDPVISSGVETSEDKEQEKGQLHDQEIHENHSDKIQTEEIGETPKAKDRESKEIEVGSEGGDKLVEQEEASSKVIEDEDKDKEGKIEGEDKKEEIKSDVKSD